jgi:hypothetical protein
MPVLTGPFIDKIKNARIQSRALYHRGSKFKIQLLGNDHNTVDFPELIRIDDF